MRIVAAALAVTASPIAYAQQASDQTITSDETIVVFGRSQTRESQVLKGIDIVEAAPGTSPLQVLNKLPGVNFQSADTFGSYEWSTRITLRGFNQNQLGFTLDDIPLGDMSYANYNGLHISRAVISENIGKTVLSEGTGALETASSSNLGGTIQFYSADPSEEFGGVLSQGFGSESAVRTYVKLDSGRLSSGTKFDISYAYQNSDKWKGEGEQRQNQINGKLVQALGDNGQFSVFVNYSDRQEIDYQDLSKQYIQKLGYNWDNYLPNWKYALDAARGIYHLGEDKTSDPLDAAYYAGSGLRTDVLTGGTLDYALNDDISIKFTPYHHSNDGRGLWYTPYTPSPNGTPISTRTTEYEIDRTGVIAGLTGTYGINKINAGVWYESNSFNNARRFYADSLSGPISPYDFPSNPFLTQWQYQFDTDTLQFHLQDTVSITDALTVNVGFKSLSVSTTSTTQVGAIENGTLDATNNFLPQAGINYAISDDQQLYFNFAQNMRAFQGAATGISPFALLDQANFNRTLKTVKPEQSDTFEAGWRFRNALLEAQATVYHIDFYNRLLAVAVGSAIQGFAPVIGNVGGVETNGAEAGISLHPIENWNLLTSVSFNDSTYNDNYFSGGTLVATQGKEVVDSPKWMLKSELSYDDGNLYGHVGIDYFAKRYYTYTNDNYAGSYAVANLGIGYRIHEPFAHIREMDIQVNVNNLFDRGYISTIGSNGFVNSDPNGTAQTLLTAAPREAFANVTLKF
jgi:iron complex outermembrane receptor protein